MIFIVTWIFTSLILGWIFVRSHRKGNIRRQANRSRLPVSDVVTSLEDAIGHPQEIPDSVVLQIIEADELPSGTPHPSSGDR